MSLQRTGRVTVYTNQVPYEADILRSNMYKMVDVAKLGETILGTGTSNSTKYAGGACTPTGPASLAVNIAPITFYQTDEYDATDYGVIPLDTTPIYKQAINLDTTLVSNLNPPIVVATTNYYLIQAELLTTDANVVSRPYYNPANPSVPIFTSQSDTRVDSVALSLKVSTSSTPSPDSGKIGLWAVSVAYGQTSVTSGDITPYTNTPRITEGLTQKISAGTAQAGAFSYAVDSGSANALVTTFTPTITALTDGMVLRVKANASNTTATTISVDSISKNIYVQTSAGAVALTGGEIVAGLTYLLEYNGTQFVVLNPTSSSAAGTVLAGTILDFGGTSVPAGFLGCDGASYLRSDYPALFAKISTTWGSVDGTHFNVPDFRRRTSIGSGGSGSGIIGNSVGNTGGEEEHMQTEAELATHSHVSPDDENFLTYTAGAVAEINSVTSGLVQNSGDAKTKPTGSSTPFNVIQPSAVVLRIIKT